MEKENSIWFKIHLPVVKFLVVLSTFNIVYVHFILGEKTALDKVWIDVIILLISAMSLIELKFQGKKRFWATWHPVSLFIAYALYLPLNITYFTYLKFYKHLIIF